MITLIETMTTFINKCGGQLYIFDYSQDIKELEKKIDGLLIPGGRDIDPAHYNQKPVSAILEEDSMNRYPFMKDLYLKLDPSIPVFAICWGF